MRWLTILFALACLSVAPAVPPVKTIDRTNWTPGWHGRPFEGDDGGEFVTDQPTLDQLLANLDAANKALADAQAKQKAAADALGTAWKAMCERMAALGFLPPAPPPPPPVVDPLVKAVQDGYTADAAPDKAASLAYLKASYAYLAANVPASKTTNAAVVAWMKPIVEAENVGLTPAQLKAVRQAIADDLAKAWGPTPSALSNENAKAELKKISDALNAII